MWTSEQEAWLDTSPLRKKLQDRWLQIREDMECLLVVGANELVLAKHWHSKTGHELITEQSVKWAAATLLSRAFSLDLNEEEPMEGDMSYFGSWQAHQPDVLALVPWADLLCHSSEAGQEACLRYNCDLKAVVLYAHKAYQANEEVFDSYGPHLSPGDLLMDYGFVDPSNTHHRYDADPHDVVRPRSSRHGSLWEAVTSLQGSASLSLTPAGPDTTCLAWLRAALATPVELVKAGWRVKATAKDVDLACRVLGALGQPLSTSTELAVLNAMEEFIRSKLAGYSSTLEEDQKTLAEMDNWTQQQVLLVLISEKKALTGCLEVVTNWRRALEEGQSPEEVYMDWDAGGYEEEEEEEEEGEKAEVGVMHPHPL